MSSFKAIPLLLFLRNRHHGKLAMIVIYVLIVFASLMVFLTGSRTGMIGVLVVLLLYKRSIKWWIALAVMGIFAFYLGTNFADTSWGSERVARVYEAFITGNPTSVEEVEFRLNHLEIGFEAFQKEPFIGYGYGSWDYIRGQAYDIIGSELAAHSAYALLMSETGLVGIVLFFTMVYYCIRKSNFKTSKNYQEDLQYVTALCVITYILLGFNSSSFWHRDFTIYLGLLAGSKISSIRNTKHKFDHIGVS